MKLSDVTSGAAAFASPPPMSQPPDDPTQPPPLRTGIDDGTKQAAPTAAPQPAKQGGPLKLNDVLGGAGGAPPPAPTATGPLSPKPAAKTSALGTPQEKKSKLTPAETQLAENNAFLRGIPGATYANDAHAALVGAADWLQGKSFKEGYQHNREERTRIFEEYDSEHPVASTLRTLAGAGASMAVTPEIKALQGLGLVGRSAVGSLFSGIAGTVQGFAEGATLDERKKNALMGGAFGTVAGLIFPPLGALARSPIGRAGAGAGVGAAVGAVEDPNHIEGAEIGATTGAALAVGANRLNRFGSPKEWAASYLGRALSRDSVSKEAAQKIVSKTGRSLSDVGGESVVAAGEQAALTGAGRKLGANLYISDRLAGREKAMAHVVDHLISDQGMYESVDSLVTGRSIAAQPLYQKAFEKADSEAVFLNSRTQNFDMASKAARESFEAVDAAERDLTLAEGKLHRAGDNVYGVNSGKAEVDAATKKLEQAKAAHEGALSQKEHARGQLRTSQADEESGARSGINTPYLQRVLRDPISQQGLREGLEVQRLEALSQRRPFDPGEYAVTGEHPNGDPIVGKVPNLRTYDAVKRGYDAILEKTRDPITGKIPSNAIMALRKELVKELDAHAPPEYAAARKAWEGPSRMIDAVYEGKVFHNKAPEIIKKYVDGLTPAEHDAYKIGVARWWSDMIGGGAGAPLKAAKRMLETNMKERMLAAFKGDQAALDRLIEHAGGEVEDARRAQAILGGSQTARRTEGAKEFDELGPVADDFLAGARSGITGLAASVKQHIGRSGMRWVMTQIEGMSEARRAALGGLLFSKDKEANMQALEMIYKESIMHPKMPWVMRHDPTPSISAGVSGLLGRMNTSSPPDATPPQQPPAP